MTGIEFSVKNWEIYSVSINTQGMNNCDHCNKYKNRTGIICINKVSENAHDLLSDYGFYLRSKESQANIIYCRCVCYRKENKIHVAEMYQSLGKQDVKRIQSREDIQIKKMIDFYIKDRKISRPYLDFVLNIDLIKNEERYEHQKIIGCYNSDGKNTIETNIIKTIKSRFEERNQECEKQRKRIVTSETLFSLLEKKPVTFSQSLRFLPYSYNSNRKTRQKKINNDQDSQIKLSSSFALEPKDNQAEIVPNQLPRLKIYFSEFFSA